MIDSVGTPEDVMVSGRMFIAETDEAFVYATWRNGAYYGVKRDQPATDFFRDQTAKIREILKVAQVRIACIKDAPEVILGYAVVTGGNHLEWIFVKQQFRGKGIAKYITPGVETVTSDLTRIGASIVKKKNLTIKGEKYEIPSE